MNKSNDENYIIWSENSDAFWEVSHNTQHEIPHQTQTAQQRWARSLTGELIIDFKTSQCNMATTIPGKTGVLERESEWCRRAARRTAAVDHFMQICSSCTKFHAETCLYVSCKCGHWHSQGKEGMLSESNMEPSASGARIPTDLY